LENYFHLRFRIKHQKVIGLFKKRKKIIFSSEEEVEIVKAIDEAENKTSGEIRIQVEAVCNSFQKLKERHLS
jgi:hypothetical protein